MVRVMIQNNEYIIGVSDDLTKIQLRNPHDPQNTDTDGRFKALRLIIDGAIQVATGKLAEKGQEGGLPQAVIPSLDLRTTQTYKWLLEVKETYEKLTESLKVVNATLTGQEALCYNLVLGIMEKMERESQAGRGNTQP